MPEAIEPLCKVVLSDTRSCVEPQVTPSAILGMHGQRDDVPSPGGSLEAYAESRGSSMRLAIRLQWNPNVPSSTKARFRVEMLAAIERIEMG